MNLQETSDRRKENHCVWKKVKTENGLYGIIGLGRFGYALAQTLSESGKDLIIIDENEAKINSAAAFTDHAYVVQEPF